MSVRSDHEKNSSKIFKNFVRHTPCLEKNVFSYTLVSICWANLPKIAAESKCWNNKMCWSL